MLTFLFAWLCAEASNASRKLTGDPKYSIVLIVVSLAIIADVVITSLIIFLLWQWIN